MRVAEAVGAALAASGVRVVFGVVGSGNFAVTNALVDGGARFVAARHETGAATMADAYARVSGQVGVCTVHQGPGLTNATTGVAEAAKSRTPVLVLAADTGAAGVRSNFRIDQAGLAAAVGASPERAASPATAVADALRALQRAALERRTVVLNLPLDVAAAECPAGVPPAPWRVPPPPRPAAESVEALAELLGRAQRPLLIAGRGAVLAGAGPELFRLAERAGALLATTAVAHGLFRADPWSLGICGGFASPAAAELIRDSDLVVAFGAALTMWTTRHGRLLDPAATVVQVDVEPAALGANHRIDLGVVADAAATARDVAGVLPTRPGRRNPPTRERIASGRWARTAYADAGGGGRIDPRTLSLGLERVLPAERTVAIDSGHFMGWPAMYWSVPDERGFVFTQAFQSVGLGLASAVGAAVARPDRLTVAALGDGGTLMSLPELETAVRLRLPMVIVVYDDAAYGAEVHHFGPSGAALDIVRFPETDFAALARGLGADGLTVCRTADLAGVGEWLAGDRSRPLVVDAKVAPGVVAEWLEEAFRGH